MDGRNRLSLMVIRQALLVWSSIMTLQLPVPISIND